VILDHFRNLAALRQFAGLTQQRLGDILAVGQPNIARLEKNPETASLQQLGDWVSACGLDTRPNGLLDAELDTLEISDTVGRARAIEAILLSGGIAVDLRRKPLIAILSSQGDAVRLVNQFTSNLLSSGDRSFSGFYMPSPQATVLWKHVSDRPTHRTDTCYVLEGLLEPWMRATPTEHLPLALDEEGAPLAGSLAMAAHRERPVVVFADHPLLKHCDVLQLPQLGENPQAFENWQMMTHAEIRVLGSASSAALSGASFLAGAVSGGFDFVVFPEGARTDEVEAECDKAFGGRPGAFTVPPFGGAIQGRKAVVNRFVAMVADYSRKSQRHTDRILEGTGGVDGPSHRDAAPLSAAPQTPKQRVILEVLEKANKDAPALEQAVNSFKLTQALTNPRLDPTLGIINRKAYQSQLLRAIAAFDAEVASKLTGLATPRKITPAVRDAVKAINALTLATSAAS
jgi:hypothetical protein